MINKEAGQDPNALIAVYRETVEELYTFVYRRSGKSHELAEDVIQETYLRAVRTWYTNGIPDSPLAWLQTVARNLLLNHYRRKQPIRFDSMDIETVLETTKSNGSECSQLICWGLNHVKGKHAQLLEAFYLDGKSVRGIAAEFKVTERAIEGRLRRARLALKKLLMPHVGNNGELT